MKRILAIGVLAALAAGLTLLMIFLYKYERSAFSALLGAAIGTVIGLLFFWALSELGWLP